MALSEKELERIIESHLTEELDANIEVPDVNNQWQKIKDQILKDNQPIRKTHSNLKRIIVAATVLIIIGSINFLYPNNANAVGGKIAKFFNYIVGKTTQNKTEIYKQPNDSGIPKVQNLGSNTEKEITLDQAQTTVPFKLVTPSYLPPGVKTRRIVLTSLGADVYQVSTEYNFNEQVIVFNQQNSANGTSRGSLYDTDDTVVRDLSVNGGPAIILMNKNGINTLNWQSRGLMLQIRGKVSEDEIIKIADSIK